MYLYKKKHVSQQGPLLGLEAQKRLAKAKAQIVMICRHPKEQG